MKGLWDRVDFAFQKNDHTAAELLLYPQGFQQYTPTPDNGIFTALAGDDFVPAIADKVWDEENEEWVIEDTDDPDESENRFDPDLSAELYITNGDTLDDGYHTHGILGFTPEGSEPSADNVSGFEFEDDEDACRPSSSGTCCSRSTSPARLPTRRTRRRTWATRPRPSTRPVRVLLRRPADGRGDRAA